MSSHRRTAPVDEQPLRYLVRHFHQPIAAEQGEVVVVSYNTAHERSFEYAIHTAKRYGGTIYADYGENDPETRAPLYSYLRGYDGSQD